MLVGQRQTFCRMDSFVLSETLKYLYMIFTEPADLYIDPDNYVLTTEAHFIPLSIADADSDEKVNPFLNSNCRLESPKIQSRLLCVVRELVLLQLPRRLIIDPDEVLDDEGAIHSRKFRSACPVTGEKFSNLPAYAKDLRHGVQNIVDELTRNSEPTGSCPKM